MVPCESHGPSRMFCFNWHSSARCTSDLKFMMYHAESSKKHRYKWMWIIMQVILSKVSGSALSEASGGLENQKNYKAS